MVLAVLVLVLLVVMVVVAVVVLVILFSFFHAQDIAPHNFGKFAAASLHSASTRFHIRVQPGLAITRIKITIIIKDNNNGDNLHLQ